MKNTVCNFISYLNYEREYDQAIDYAGINYAPKVVPYKICFVTSQFTKLFYCEHANVAHIQSGDKKIAVLTRALPRWVWLLIFQHCEFFFQFFQFNSRKKVKNTFFSNFFPKMFVQNCFFLLKKKQTLLHFHFVTGSAMRLLNSTSTVLGHGEH